MALYTSPGFVATNPVFSGVVSADAFAAKLAGNPATFGAFRTGHDVDVLVARDTADTTDISLLTIVGSAMQIANPSSVSYIVVNQYVGGASYDRFAGVDTLVTTGTHLERSKPEHGGDPTFAPSPYGTDGLRDVANPDADYTEIPDNYRFRRLTYTGATTVLRTISFPAATTDDGYYEKTIRNQTGNNLTINTVGSIGLGVTIANNKTAIVGFTRFTALRSSPDA